MSYELSIKEIVVEVIKCLEETKGYQQSKFKQLFIPNVDFLNPEVCNLKYTNKSDHTRCALSKKGRVIPTCEKLVCAGIRCRDCICDISNKAELNEHIEKLKKDKKSLFIPDVNFLKKSICTTDTPWSCALPRMTWDRAGGICKGIGCIDCICYREHRKELIAHIKKLKESHFIKGQQVLVSDNGGYICRRIFSHAVKNNYFTFKDGQTEWTSNGKIEEWENCEAYHNLES